MTHDLNQIEQALRRASERGSDLTPDERAAVRDVLEWWRAWNALGRVGRFALWAMITLGAVAAAAREVFAWLR